MGKQRNYVTLKEVETGLKSFKTFKRLLKYEDCYINKIIQGGKG